MTERREVSKVSPAFTRKNGTVVSAMRPLWKSQILI